MVERGIKGFLSLVEIPLSHTAGEGGVYVTFVTSDYCQELTITRRLY